MTHIHLFQFLSVYKAALSLYIDITSGTSKAQVISATTFLVAGIMSLEFLRQKKEWCGREEKKNEEMFWVFLFAYPTKYL